MSILKKIIDEAVDGGQSVASLLRSAQVLAVRSRAVDLSGWIKKERDGYGPDDVLPEYRGPFHAQVLGHFVAPFGREVKNLPIPRHGWPEQFDSLFEVSFRGPVSELEELAKSDQAALESPWTGDALLRANALMDKGEISAIPMHSLATAHRVVPRTLISSAVDAVRNRVLDLALELEQVVPGFAEADGSPQENREQVSAVFQTIVHAQNAYVGANTTTQQVNIAVTPGDVESLARYLDGIRGLSEDDKKELVAAASAARSQGSEAVEHNGRLKAALRKLGAATGKALQEGANVAIKVAIERWLGPPTA